ncbi:hypothetical protein [Fervidobacterium thailandense]|uniref:Uncharacterized protein n=1 Tax=Fervidobacterium thailandense TaxID=1008305 RepID=A0A1E3G360_9BACT|nr:hypothetical protein [Fervidobacterium thailandense]ODN30649.1 hypothetical protein A4H02_03665 [Fervidobacterium thailandense]
MKVTRKFPEHTFVNFLFVLILIVLFGCAKSTQVPSTKLIRLKTVEYGRINEEISIIVETVEPGVKIKSVTVSSDGSVQKLSIPSSHPYIISWKPTKPGKYTVEVTGYSLITGQEYRETKTVFIYDTSGPIIEYMRLIPPRPYKNEDVLLQIKVGGRNPLVKLVVEGAVSKDLEIPSGVSYIPLGVFSEERDYTVSVAAKVPDSDDATTITFRPTQRDAEPPRILINTDLFYPQNMSTIPVEFRIEDNVGLKSYELYFDGALKEKRDINGKVFNWTYVVTDVQNGPHTVGVVAYDDSGNIFSSSKTFYVGAAGVAFKIQVQPESPEAGQTVLIVAVPMEQIGDVLSKIVYFVDGKKIAEYPNEEISEVRLYTPWVAEEGEHNITVYVEAGGGKRAGLANTTIFVPDRTPPKLVRIKVNGVEIQRDAVNYIIPGEVKFEVEVEDPGKISTSDRPRLLLREDEFSYYYRDLSMYVSEIMEAERRVIFTVQTTIAPGTYKLEVKGVKDKTGNTLNVEGYTIVAR